MYFSYKITYYTYRLVDLSKHVNFDISQTPEK